ncbi:hypothetical protein [Actinomadura atramentaria]|uniref:hypothetical protein n=1 Tax=Actinomadura atramentaria TaxID=1990 RepID=UPI0003785DDA|nr:hypothetical protein [Actinomadura atramentaria]
MPALPSLLTNAPVFAAAAAFTYALTLCGVALVSVTSRSPARRRDARSTLAILLGRSPQR